MGTWGHEFPPPQQQTKTKLICFKKGDTRNMHVQTWTHTHTKIILARASLSSHNKPIIFFYNLFSYKTTLLPTENELRQLLAELLLALGMWKQTKWPPKWEKGRHSEKPAWEDLWPSMQGHSLPVIIKKESKESNSPFTIFFTIPTLYHSSLVTKPTGKPESDEHF